MSDDVKARRYDASGRQAAAVETRRRILAAASERFLADGYAATTVAVVARQAGVSVDTVYASVGPKPALFRELVELALSGTDRPVEGGAREYAVRMRAEPSATGKLAIYADAVSELQGRVAPLFLVLRDAASAHPDLAQVWREITERRARNMRRLAADLASTGELREDLTLDEVADVVWTTNGAEHYAMLVRDRGWSTERFRWWLLDSWQRLLLKDVPAASAGS
ncbi:TetR/AcrR family transcriptional regulator [Microlunatus flavus]|uniref:DNA-binding transcriptional regulator, AcrR family n=1 Tax=Microlunatus flavus TaxID=1036181 RepID=A0A1H9ASV5_9ACTN|nr:TetR/AcrR family transcriptional regulator [Microlunatus flavus]SEP79615.1 DNA-binding transcriptional regulator, AcrR family [Microlunatus flavus]